MADNVADGANPVQPVTRTATAGDLGAYGLRLLGLQEVASAMGPVAPGSTTLAWGDRLGLRPTPISERLPTLVAQRMFHAPLSIDPVALLTLAGVPMWTLTRPRDEPDSPPASRPCSISSPDRPATPCAAAGSTRTAGSPPARHCAGGRGR
jgi:hypothetical protein